MQLAVKNAPKVGDKVTFIREFAAPRELVFKLWTDPQHLARWWGPEGFTNPVCRFEPWPGGQIHIDMRAPDGTVYPMGGEVRVIDPPKKLVMLTTALFDADGVPALEGLVTANFSEANGRTKLFLEDRILKAEPEALAALAGMEQGWSESLVRLADLTRTIEQI
jgi:uncharacterized protein YndB with AHSA1/START domain